MPSRRRARGFSIVELLVALLIMAVIIIITVTEVNRGLKRAKLESVAQDIRNFAQRALIESQKSNLQIFLTVEAKAADGTTPISLYTDVNSDSVFTSGTDTLITQYTVPSDIVLFIVPQTKLTSYYWISNPAPGTSVTADTDDSAVARTLMIDFRGRTINVATNSQINGIAKLAVSHQDMASTTPSLTPRTEYEVRISPLWSATIVKSLY